MFSVSELGLSLSETYDITWAEFCIQSRAYNRREAAQMEKLRLLAYANFLANWQSKKTPPSIEKYWPLTTTEKKKANNEELKKKFLQAAERFYNKGK